MVSAQVWDPFGTLHNALWIGGGQWAGKSTVARLLAQRHGITAYHYDYHDARGHNDRGIARHLASANQRNNRTPTRSGSIRDLQQLAIAVVVTRR
jgi:adenylylsulfate kinase-like enzyme